MNGIKDVFSNLLYYTYQKGIDFDDLLDGSRGNVVAHSGPRIYGYNDSLVKLECQGGGSLGKLDRLGFISTSTNRGKVAAAIKRRLVDESVECDCGVYCFQTKRERNEQWNVRYCAIENE